MKIDASTPRPRIGPPSLLTLEQVMERCGVQDSNPSRFRASARRTGLARIKLNKRVIRYDPADVEAWLRHRRWA